MKKFLQELNCGFTKFTSNSRALIALVIMFGMNQTTVAQSSGIFESFAILSINGGANTFYDMQAATPNADFQGLNLGNITFGSGSLIVRGGQNKTFKNSGCNINSSAILYRVYPTANPSGTFISVNEQFDANIGGSGDQQWTTNPVLAVNAAASLIPGNYTIEVFSQAGFDSCGSGTVFSSNGGANYKATFTVVANPALPIIVTSTTGTGSPSTGYATLAAAVTAINTGAHTGTTTCLVPAGYTETAPVGGYSISATGTASTPITFIKSGTGANPVLNAYSGGTGTPGTAVLDGIFKISGGDYITLDGLTFTDNNAANPATMEYGIGLFKASVTDGANNNTIKNCVTNMQRINFASGSTPMVDGSVGILMLNSTIAASTTALTPTSASGSNSNNVFYNNTINGGNIGIALIGYAAPSPFSLADTNNDIGGSSIATKNDILNFGGGTSATNPAAGVRTLAQYGLNVSYNIINNNNGSGVNHISTMRGIFTNTALSASENIVGNTVTLTSGATTSQVSFIENAAGSTAASNTININNNTLTGSYLGATSPLIYSIYNTGTATNVNINSNIISNINVGTSGAVTGVTFYGIFNSVASTNFTANSNIISGITINNVGGTFYGIRGSTSLLIHNLNQIFNISFPNNNTAGSVSMFGIYNFASPTSEVFQNNQIYNFSINGNTTSTSSAINGINTNTTASSVKDWSGNRINGLSFSNTSTGSAVVNGINTSSGNAIKLSKNKINDLSAQGAGSIVKGININSGTALNIDNNYIGNLSASTATGTNAIVGIDASGSSTYNMYFNTIYLNATSTSATTFGSSAIYFSSTATSVDLRNNILVNASSPALNGSNVAANGISAVLRRSSGTAATVPTNYATTANNNLFWSNPTSGTNNHLTYCEGIGTITNAKNTVANLKTFMVNRDQNSIQENPTFVSTTGSASTFLHIDPTVATGIEKGAIAIATYTTDYDGDIRGSVPDIGADEGTFSALPVPTISSLATLSGCQGTSLVVTGTNLANVSTATIGGTAATVTATTATTATITVGSGTTGVVTLTSPSGTATGTDTFTVFPAPTTTWSASAAAVCLNASAQTTTLAYSATTGSPTTYSITWAATPTNSFVAVTDATFTGAVSGGTISINVPAGTAIGTYIGTIKVKNAGGCISTGTQTFTLIVSGAPVAPTTTGLSICTGATIAAGSGLATTSVGAATLTGSQTLNFNVTAQPVETNAAPGNVVASATLTALPAGATVTSIVYTYNGITALGSSFRTDVKLGLSGSLIESAASGTGALSSAGVLNYTRTATTGITGTPSIGGNVNLLYWDDLSDNAGAEATFTTGSPAATVVVNYSYPNPTAISWYTTATGGTSIGNGSPFNPIGVAGSGLADSNTPGVYPFYAEISNGTCPSTRTIANLTIGAALTTSVTASPGVICEGGSATINNVPAGGSLPYTYSWSDGAGVVGTTQSVVVSPTTTKTYTVTITDGCGTIISSPVIVMVNPLPIFTVTNPAAVCSPATVDITAAIVQTSNNGAVTKYYTTNALALAGAASDVTNPSALTTSGTYFIRSETSLGCFKILPVTVLVNTSPTLVSVTPTTATVCDGVITTLVATGGLVPTIATIGTDTTLNVASSTTATAYPAPYGAYYENSKQQYLIRASELTVAGLMAGSTINNLSFDVTTLGTSGVHKAYTISIGNTTQTAIATYETGLTTVFGPTDYQPVSGINIHTFSSAFTWNGTSNIIIQVCHTNDATSAGSFFTANAVSKYSTTAFNSSLTYRVDNTDACGSSLITYTEAQRPNILFGYSGQGSVTWSPTTALFTNAAATVAYTGSAATTVYAKPSTDTTYTATATLGSCTKTATSVITVNPNLPASVTAVVSPTGAVCAGTSLTFTATATNGGITPTYQWRVNGVNVSGATGSVFATSTLANNDVVTVVMTSNASPCLTGSPATSAGLTLSITPNSFNDTTITACDTYTWTNNGVTYNASGTYTGIVAGCVTERLILTITPILTPTFTQVAPICLGEIIAALPTTSNNGVAGSWSPALNNTVTTTYTFTPTTCGNTTTMTIAVGGTKTWNAGWTPAGSPTSIDTVLINGNYNAATDGGTINGCTMTVDNNAVVVMTSGTNIILNGKLTVTSGSVTMNNNANLLQTLNVANSGSITVNRNSSSLFRQDYTLWGSPVTGAQTLFSFSPSTLPARFYTYDSTLGTAGLYAVVPSPSTTTFALAKAYHIRMPNFWSATIASPYLGSFIGTPNNGNVPFTMSNTAAGFGFNAVANPYPSAMSMFSFVAANVNNITGTLYFWRKTNNAASPSYSTWTAGTFISNGEAQVTDPLGILSSGQGFLVEAKQAATSLVFDNSMRVIDNVGHFFRSPTTIEYNRIWLNAKNNDAAVIGSFSQMAVGYITDATMSIDGFDGKFKNDGDISLTSLIDTEKYAIQGRSLPFNSSDIVPMSFKATTTGNYNISIDHVDGLFATSSDIYLRDNLTGSITNLTTSAYDFAANAGTDDSRFELLYTTPLSINNVALNENNVIVYKNNGFININSGVNTMNNVKIFDIRGRLLIEKTNVNATQTSIDSSSFGNQVLVVQITSTSNIKVSKKIVN